MGEARLIIRVEGESKERVHKLSDDVTTVGRGVDNIIQIRDPKSSRKHFKIEKTDDGYRLVDFESANGTRVNGTRVRQQTLRVGDKITVGQMTFLFDQDVAADAESLGATVQVDTLDEDEIALAPDKPVGTDKPKYVLEIIAGKQKGQVIELGDGPVTIGRHSSNSFRIDDEGASSYHSEIKREGSVHVIADLGSTNGTRVNEEKIVKQALTVGSVVRIGSTKFAFKGPGGEEEDDELFGTIVLDEDKIPQVLSAGPQGPALGPKARKAALVAGAAVAGIALLYGLIAALGALFSGGTTHPDDLLQNGSFDGEVGLQGNPMHWSRSGGGSSAQWEVSRTDDAQEGKGSPAALVLRRSGSAPDLYAAYVYETPLPLQGTGRVYRLSGYVKGPGATGEYGLQVTWEAKGGMTETERIVLAGSHPAWKKVAREFVPPPWAISAQVGCVSHGHRGTIYWDDIAFVPAVKSVKAPRPPARKAGALEMIFQRTGVLELNSGGIRAVSGVSLYLLGQAEGRIESSQELAWLAGHEPPAHTRESDTFHGEIRDFVSDGRIRYRQEVLSAAEALEAIYTVRAGDGQTVALKELGLRFTVLGPFSAAPHQVYRNGALARRTDGAIQAVQELIFHSEGVGQIAVFLGDAGRDVKITRRGSRTQVEVRLVGSRPLTDVGETFKVVFSRSSRLRLSKFQAKFDRFMKLLRDKPYGESFQLGDELVQQFGDEFPNRVDDVKRELQIIKDELDVDLELVERKIQALREADEANWPKTLEVARRTLDQTEAKWAKTPFEDRFAEKQKELDGLVAGQEAKSVEAEARKLLDKGRKFYAAKVYPVARSFVNKLVTDPRFANTGAAREARDGKLLELIEQKMKP